MFEISRNIFGLITAYGEFRKACKYSSRVTLLSLNQYAYIYAELLDNSANNVVKARNKMDFYLQELGLRSKK